MLRSLSIVAVFALAFQSPASAAPLQPTGKWVMNYTPTACEAKRRFGEIGLAIIPGPLGQSTRLMVELPGKAMRARQHRASIDPEDGRGAVKATALLFPLKKPGARGLYTVLPNELVERAMASGMISIRVGSEEMSGRVALNSAFTQLALGSTGSLRKALDTCMADLRTQWGMVDGKLPKPANASQARGDVRAIFTGDDYPEDAVAAGQGGITQYLLMIGRDGSVMDCVVAQSSGIASLDAMGCQVIRERAKFTAGSGSDGKPATDTYMTPPIRWVLN